jgi:hypothetical protein
MDEPSLVKSGYTNLLRLNHSACGLCAEPE